MTKKASASSKVNRQIARDVQMQIKKLYHDINIKTNMLLDMSRDKENQYSYLLDISWVHPLI